MAKILVVDDEPLIAMMLADWLAEQGQETVGPAHTEGQALELIDERPIDAAILDVSLGDGDCFGIAARLHDMGIPFAFATGLGGDAVIEEFRVNPKMSKPFNFEAVARVLDALVGDEGREPDVKD